MQRGIQAKGMARRNKMVRAAIRLILENGYEATSTIAIAKAAGYAPSAFFSVFNNKEALLLFLTNRMFAGQFAQAEHTLGSRADPLLVYAAECALQLHITELSESVRSAYTAAYSLPTTSEFIYRHMAERLMHTFAPYMPGAELKDFYEMEIASGGIMRGFSARPCDMYFTMERKVRRFLGCVFTMFRVPDEKQEKLIGAVLQLDLQTAARNLVRKVIAEAESDMGMADDTALQAKKI